MLEHFQNLFLTPKSVAIAMRRFSPEMSSIKRRTVSFAGPLPVAASSSDACPISHLRQGLHPLSAISIIQLVSTALGLRTGTCMLQKSEMQY